MIYRISVDFSRLALWLFLKTESRSAAITVSSALRRCKARMIMPAWKRCLEEDFCHGLEERQQIDQGEKVTGGFTVFPDLIMMDGGKGQVNVAESVLRELGIVIPVCGMVKDDRHRTRGLYFQGSEIPVNTCSEGFHLMTRIQDEVHRFAIEYHRSLRSKVQVRSILDDIAGIGAKRRKQLMKRFVSLDAIKAASVEQLAEVESMNEQAAQNVYEFFHKKDS